MSTDGSTAPRPGRTRPPKRNPPAPPALRTRRHRAGGAADPSPLSHRRAREIDRVILAGFVPGLSTRKIGEVLLPLLGRPVSPATVSRVAGTPDAAFHRRRLDNRYKALMLDGVVPARRICVGAVGRPVPVALGILPDGRKGIIDFQPARGESAAEWECLLSSLHRRGLTGQGLEVICADGGNGLLACFRYPTPDGRRQVRTTNAIKRRFREVRRRTRPMGTFRDRTSMECVLFAIFSYQNKKDRTATPFTVTHNS